MRSVLRDPSAPLLIATAGLLIATLALEILLPVTPWPWLLLRLALPIATLTAIVWAFRIFLRAGQLPRWWPSFDRRDQ